MSHVSCNPLGLSNHSCHNLYSKLHKFISLPHNLATSPHSITSYLHESIPFFLAASPHSITSYLHESIPFFLAASPHSITSYLHKSIPFFLAASPHSITSYLHKSIPFFLATSPHSIISYLHKSIPFFLQIYRGGKINAVGCFQRTPLHEATVYGNMIAVKYFLENDADMELKDENGNQAIHLASRTGNIEYIGSTSVISCNTYLWQGLARVVCLDPFGGDLLSHGCRNELSFGGTGPKLMPISTLFHETQ